VVKISSNEVLAQSKRLKNYRPMLNSIRSRNWIGHALQHDKLLYNLMEGRIVGKPTRSRRKLQMLEDLYQNSSYEVFKRTAEDRSTYLERKHG